MPGKDRLKEGGSFGLKSLLFRMPLEYSAIAATPVDAFTFSSAAFSAVLKDHPQARTRIQQDTAQEYGVAMQIP